MNPLVVELCSGTAVISKALARLGWDTFTVDIEAKFNPDLVRDVCLLEIDEIPRRPQFVWAAPPCFEFSRHSMPWTRARNPPRPSIQIVRNCLELIKYWRPIYWGLENVRGAIPFLKPALGSPVLSCGSSFFAWGHLPPVGEIPHPGAHKGSKSSSAVTARASYPPGMVRAITEAVNHAVRNQ